MAQRANRLASFHCLRKTFATYLALADVPIRVAMDMMHVTDAKLLTGVYTDAKLFNMAAAAERLPRLHRPAPEAEKAEKGPEAAAPLNECVHGPRMTAGAAVVGTEVERPSDLCRPHIAANGVRRR